MCRKCLYRLLLLLCFVGLPLTLAAAQPGNVHIIKTADASLDESEIHTAARVLTERDVRLGVYLVSSGSEQDLSQRLRADGLGNSQGPYRDVVAIYVGVNNRYSEIRWGANFNSRLEPIGRDIRSTRLNPRLRDGDFTAGFVDTINAVEQALAGTYVSSGIRGSSSSNNSFDFEAILPYLLVIGLVGIWIYCLATGKCKSSGSDNTYYDSGSSSFGSGGSSSSSGSSGGHDGGSWDD